MFPKYYQNLPNIFSNYSPYIQNIMLIFFPYFCLILSIFPRYSLNIPINILSILYEYSYKGVKIYNYILYIYLYIPPMFFKYSPSILKIFPIFSQNIRHIFPIFSPIYSQHISLYLNHIPKSYIQINFP